MTFFMLVYAFPAISLAILGFILIAFVFGPVSKKHPVKHKIKFWDAIWSELQKPNRVKH